MSMTREHRQEGLSLAYIHAVAALAGWTWSGRSTDYGADISLCYVEQYGHFRFESAVKIDVQAKSTASPVLDQHCLRFDLPVSNYEWLRRSDVYCPRVLAVLVLPPEEAKWLSISEKQLVMKNCMYWTILKGSKPTKNKRTVRVELPRKNVFSADALRQIYLSVKQEKTGDFR